MGRQRSGSSAGNLPAASGTGDRPAPRRGRPQKFGRPSQVVALTLPEEVIEALRTVHRDPGWAIVQLVEPILHSGEHRRQQRPHRAPAELVHLPGGRALIVVEPRVFKGLHGVSTIPLADGGAFLALDNGGLADLEVAIIDRLEATPMKTMEHDQLMEVRNIVREWRRDTTLAFRTKSIIVAEGAVGVERGPLSTLDGADRQPHKGSPSRTRPGK